MRAVSRCSTLLAACGVQSLRSAERALCPYHLPTWCRGCEAHNGQCCRLGLHRVTSLTFPDPVGAATPELIGRLIGSATERLIVLAPAVSMDVARAIEERWVALGAERVSIILDVDPEVYRLGYGDPRALSHLETVGSQVGGLLQRHGGIRIGVIVADENALVYSPAPALIEAGPRDARAPNAVFLNVLPRHLERALGFGESAHRDQTVGLDKATQHDIAELQEDLRSNPPQKFDVQRQLRVFNAAFQFVELRVLGTNVARRTVRLPTRLLGMTDEQTRDDLRMGLRLVPLTHDLSGRDLDVKRRRIEKRHLTIVPGYGYAIRRAAKEEFLRDLETLKQEVERFKTKVAADLDNVIGQRLDQLLKAFLPRLREDPPSSWLLPASNRPEREEALSTCLTEDLREALGNARDYVPEMRVQVVFKDVTYESLQDQKFMDAARAAFSESVMPQLYQEWKAAPSEAGTEPG